VWARSAGSSRPWIGGSRTLLTHCSIRKRGWSRRTTRSSAVPSSAFEPTDCEPSTAPGHHVVALESLADTLGVTLDRIDYFQTLRDLRNKDIYTGSSHVSDTQALEAVRAACRLAADTRRWLESRGSRTAG